MLIPVTVRTPLQEECLHRLERQSHEREEPPCEPVRLLFRAASAIVLAQQVIAPQSVKDLLDDEAHDHRPTQPGADLWVELDRAFVGYTGWLTGMDETHVHGSVNPKQSA